MGIKNAAKALIINNGKILLNKCQNSLGDAWEAIPNGAVYYDLPGGGQNQYETLTEAVKRECLEETGYTVDIKNILLHPKAINDNLELVLKSDAVLYFGSERVR